MKPSEQKPRIIVEASRNQFDSSYKMLSTLVDICSDDIWYEYFNDHPFWYHVYHVAYFIDFWLRTSYDDADFRSMKFDEGIPPEFEHEVSRELFIPREAMKEYLIKIQIKTTQLFDIVDDELIATSPIGQKTYTYADIIMTQIRHIMYNIGYLNGILRSHGAEEADWYAYNEDDD